MRSLRVRSLMPSWAAASEVVRLPSAAGGDTSVTVGTSLLSPEGSVPLRRGRRLPVTLGPRLLSASYLAAPRAFYAPRDHGRPAPAHRRLSRTIGHHRPHAKHQV